MYIGLYCRMVIWIGGHLVQIYPNWVGDLLIKFLFFPQSLLSLHCCLLTEYVVCMLQFAAPNN